MSKAKVLVDRIIAQIESGGTYDWRRVREEIHEAHDAAETEADRVLCLNMRNSRVTDRELCATSPPPLVLHGR